MRDTSDTSQIFCWTDLRRPSTWNTSRCTISHHILISISLQSSLVGEMLITVVPTSGQSSPENLERGKLWRRWLHTPSHKLAFWRHRKHCQASDQSPLTTKRLHHGSICYTFYNFHSFLYLCICASCFLFPQSTVWQFMSFCVLGSLGYMMGILAAHRSWDNLSRSTMIAWWRWHLSIFRNVLGKIHGM